MASTTIRPSRTIKPRGPSQMKANSLMQDSEGKYHKINGYSGCKGWAYHPTKGFRKVRGFNPSQLMAVNTNKVEAALESNTLAL